MCFMSRMFVSKRLHADDFCRLFQMYQCYNKRTLIFGVYKKCLRVTNVYKNLRCNSEKVLFAGLAFVVSTFATRGWRNASFQIRKTLPNENKRDLCKINLSSY